MQAIKYLCLLGYPASLIGTGISLCQAMVILWNYKDRAIRSSYEIHKVGIVDLCFTCNSDFLVSLGGRDDGNVIVWNVQNNSAICGIYIYIL